MPLDKEKMDEMVSELEGHEKRTYEIKGDIQNMLLDDLKEAIGCGLLSINWEAIRKRRYLRR